MVELKGLKASLFIEYLLREFSNETPRTLKLLDTYCRVNNMPYEKRSKILTAYRAAQGERV
jgi:hypothetical protein